jgi:hypothetical protein
LTFVQFLFVAITGYISQFDPDRPPFFLRPNRVPIRRWMINILLFFTINILNNHAFSYNISVPIHIILRSGGSITTLAAGFLWGKRFSRIQVIAVTLLTIGVITAAWSDHESKVCAMLLCALHLANSSLERCTDCPGPATFQHRARYPLLGPGTVGYHGLIYGGNVQRIWTALEREPILLASTRAASVYAVRPFHEETILEVGGLGPLRHGIVRLIFEPPCGPAERFGQDLYPKPACLSCHERPNSVCLHSRGQPSCFRSLGTYGYNRAQCPEVSQSAVEYLVVWPQVISRNVSWGIYRIFCRRNVWIRGQQEFWSFETQTQH